MAENIYSKGTRVWLEDKDHAWISADVLSVSKATDDTIKLIFVDERGKVITQVFSSPFLESTFFKIRKSRSVRRGKKSRKARKVCHRYETHPCLRPPMILQPSPILTNLQVSSLFSFLNPVPQLYASVLHTIRNRYGQHSIYTYSGIVLIAVNPFQRVTLYGPEIIQAYSGRKRGELEPHLFAIAEDAYTAMQKEGMGQTIIVSGERCDFIMHFS